MAGRVGIRHVQGMVSIQFVTRYGTLRFLQPGDTSAFYVGPKVKAKACNLV
jgi:hypothetical protein